MERYQPFCDIELNEAICSSKEYDEIVERMKENASRDLKFSDTEIKITALDLHRYLNYRCYVIQQDAFRLGVEAAFGAVCHYTIRTIGWIVVLGALAYGAYCAWGA